MNAPLLPRERLGRVATIFLQVATGLFFIASALGKLLGIDEFEVYLFSFGLLPLGVCLVLARVVIAVEMALGLLLAAGVAPRVATFLLTLLTLCFSLFLCYAQLAGRTDDCHCMGLLASVPPALSLLKNGVILLVLLLLLRLPMWHWRARWFVWIPLCVAVLVGVFSFSMPDNWLFGAGEEVYNAEMLHQLSENQLSEANIEQNRVMVVMASEGCHYCRKALRKLYAIARRHSIDESRFVVILPEQAEPLPDDDGPPMLQGRRYRLGNADFLHLTYGQRPILLLLDGGKTVASFHYRNIDEKTIADFLK